MAEGAVRPAVTVVLAIDESEQALKAMEFYLEVFHQTNNKVVLAHAVEVAYQPIQPLREEMVKEILSNTQSAAKQVEDRFAGILQAKGVNFEVRSEYGQPGEFVCKVASEVKASMVVLGTRGMGKIRRTILGSVSDYVVHHAKCPVFVYRE